MGFSWKRILYGEICSNLMNRIIRYFLWWLPMPVLGVINGTGRQVLLKMFFDDQVANRVSVFTLIILLFTYGLLIKNKLQITSKVNAIICSAIWVLLTLAFEFGFGLYVFHTPMEKLLADYNLAQGRLWPLILFFTGLLPFILRKLTSTS